MAIHSRLVGGALALMLTASLAQAGQILYGITLDDTLIRINTATGAGTAVGTTSVTGLFAAGLASADGTLYIYDGGNEGLRTINPVTAVVGSLAASGLLTGEGDLTFNSSGTAFLASSYLSNGDFDPNNGTLFSRAGAVWTPLAGPTPQFSGLAFGPGGLLFGLVKTGTELDTINTSTGVATKVGTTGLTTTDPDSGFAIYSLGGLAFSGNLMYGVLSNYSNSELFSVDTTTGAFTDIGSIGSGQVSGIAFVGTADAPEPATFGLAGGALALAWVARRRRTTRHA